MRELKRRLEDKYGQPHEPLPDTVDRERGREQGRVGRSGPCDRPLPVRRVDRAFNIRSLRAIIICTGLAPGPRMDSRGPALRPRGDNDGRQPAR
jgi:hypothetical protein